MHIIEALRASIAGVIKAIVFKTYKLLAVKKQIKKETSRDVPFFYFSSDERTV
jgi:hypothetical protein